MRRKTAVLRSDTSYKPPGKARREDYFRVANYPTRTPSKLCIGSCFYLPSQVLAETELFMIQRGKPGPLLCLCGLATVLLGPD